MRRGWKVLIGVVVVLAILLVLNTIALDNETRGAETTIDGGKIVSAGGTQLQVYEEGPKNPRGAPIVLLHCYGCSLHWWDKLAPLLAKDHRVVRIDLLGFGGSDKPASGYSVSEEAAVVAGALNRLGVEGAVVVGHSYGGTIATALAEQSSELVDRVVMIDTPPDPEGSQLSFPERLTHVPVLGQALWRVSPDFVVKDSYEDAFAPGFDLESGFDDPDQVVEDQSDMTYTSFDETLDEADAYGDEQPLDQRMTDAAVPLMVIFGEEDQIIDPQTALDTYAQVPGVVTTEVRDAGHSPNVEQPERTARLILDFAAKAGGLGQAKAG